MPYVGDKRVREVPWQRFQLCQRCGAAERTPCVYQNGTGPKKKPCEGRIVIRG